MPSGWPFAECCAHRSVCIEFALLKTRFVCRNALIMNFSCVYIQTRMGQQNPRYGAYPNPLVGLKEAQTWGQGAKRWLLDQLSLGVPPMLLKGSLFITMRHSHWHQRPTRSTKPVALQILPNQVMAWFKGNTTRENLACHRSFRWILKAFGLIQNKTHL